MMMMMMMMMMTTTTVRYMLNPSPSFSAAGA
jgi:hypothetical protein